MTSDLDDDNDGVGDLDDAFPLNASESLDTDGDGKVTTLMMISTVMELQMLMMPSR
jgi:hypothetical protein